MRRKGLVVIVWLVLTLGLTACGNENQPPVNSESEKGQAALFSGTWQGKCDFAEMMKSEMVADNKTLEKYINFEELSLEFEFTFSEEQMTRLVTKNSADQFLLNMENGLIAALDAMMEASAVKANMTVEELYISNETTREEQVLEPVYAMHLEQIVEALANTFEIQGDYEYDRETLILYHSKDTYEKMPYTFDGEKLTISIARGTETFDIICTKVN